MTMVQLREPGKLWKDRVMLCKDLCFHKFCECQQVHFLHSVSKFQIKPNEDVEQSVGKSYVSEITQMVRQLTISSL